MLGNIIVGGVILVIVILAARSLYRSHKSGGGCGGDCSSCGCGCSCCGEDKHK